jgi:hypothetical protein
VTEQITCFFFCCESNSHSAAAVAICF